MHNMLSPALNLNWFFFKRNIPTLKFRGFLFHKAISTKPLCENVPSHVGLLNGLLVLLTPLNLLKSFVQNTVRSPHKSIVILCPKHSQTPSRELLDMPSPGGLSAHRASNIMLYNKELTHSPSWCPGFLHDGVQAGIISHVHTVDSRYLVPVGSQNLRTRVKWFSRYLASDFSNAKLSCVAQQVGIVHFYAVTEIKGLSCRLWWMHERRNLLTSTHVGHQLCHVGSRKWRITKIWGPMSEHD